MRLVLDTNILISCCWTPGGNEWRVVELVRAGRLQACLSPALLAEYEEVAARKKFALHAAALAEIIVLLRSCADLVTPECTCTVCSDPDDNRLLECARAAGAECVVTGNLRHFPQSWQGIRVVNARALLESLENDATVTSTL